MQQMHFKNRGSKNVPCRTPKGRERAAISPPCSPLLGPLGGTGNYLSKNNNNNTLFEKKPGTAHQNKVKQKKRLFFYLFC